MSWSLSNLVPFGLFRGASDSKPPIFLDFRSSKLLIIITVSVAVYVDLFLYAVIIPVVPYALHSRVQIPVEETQYWVSVLLAVYGAALLVAAPICGLVSDRCSSRRIPFLSGLVLLISATFFIAFGNSIAYLIAGRVLQGASAAVVWVAGLALVVDTVKEDEIGQSMGYVTSSMILAVLTAPILGGVVFDRAGYEAVFAMCFGLLGVDVLLRLVMVEKSAKRQWNEAHRADSEVQSGTITPFDELPNITDSPRDFTQAKIVPSSPSVDELVNQTPGDASSTIVRHRRLRFQLPPIVTLLKSRRLVSVLWCTLVQGTLLTALDSTLPLHVRQVFGWNSIGAGLIFVPVAVPTFLAPLIGKFSDRSGPRLLCAAGFLIVCPVLILTRLVYYDSVEQKVLLCSLLFLLGIGLSLPSALTMAEITYVVEAKKRSTPSRAGIKFGKYGAYAQAYALFNMAFAGGSLIGPIWGGMIRDAAGWNTMSLTMGLLSAFTVLPALFWTGGWLFDKSKRTWPQSRPYESKEARADEELATPAPVEVLKPETRTKN